MEPVAWQVILRAEDDRVLAPSVLARRRWVSAILRIGDAFGLLVFAVADTHAHLVLVASEADAAECARRIEIAMALTLGFHFAPARLRRVNDQSHLRNVFHYVLGQPLHHGYLHDPFAECTAVHDLLGLRCVSPGLAQRVRERLPRLTRSEVERHLPGRLEPRLDGSLLGEASASAFAVVNSRTRHPRALAARHAAVHAAHPLLATDTIATALGLSRRQVQHLAALECAPAHVSAVQLQIGLRVTLSQPAVTANQPRQNGGDAQQPVA
jgi:hypothetical protein